MEKESKIILFKFFLFLLIILVLININTYKKNLKEELVNDTKKTNNNISNEEQISIDHLEGTCPRDRACAIPSCGLWIDLNNNNFCDRGE